MITQFLATLADLSWEVFVLAIVVWTIVSAMCGYCFLMWPRRIYPTLVEREPMGEASSYREERRS